MKTLLFAHPMVELIYDTLAYAIEDGVQFITISDGKFGIVVEHDGGKEKDELTKLPRRMWPGLCAMLWIFRELSHKQRLGVFSTATLYSWRVQFCPRSKRLLLEELDFVIEKINRLFSV